MKLTGCVSDFQAMNRGRTLKPGDWKPELITSIGPCQAQEPRPAGSSFSCRRGKTSLHTGKRAHMNSFHTHLPRQIYLGRLHRHSRAKSEHSQATFERQITRFPTRDRGPKDDSFSCDGVNREEQTPSLEDYWNDAGALKAASLRKLLVVMRFSSCRKILFCGVSNTLSER